ncbi:MAG TPA: hypothetical protein VFC31_04135 [Candidatus Limnocylindria bacterium]|nr:hypothetical protein [Candidatus Limnocylindria bacterium]
MNETAVALPAAERDALGRLADAILPRTETMPAASEVGVPGVLIDRVFRTAPALAPRVRAALAGIGADPSASLAEMRRDAPSLFRDVMTAVCAAYYLAPEVKDRLGYHGQEARRIDVHELPAYLADGTLDRVVARGPRYRDID